MVEADGARIGIVHDAGAGGRAGSSACAAASPAARAVVFGHSHIPLLEVAPDGFAIFNPGSPTDRRRQPRPHDGDVPRSERGAIAFAHVELG